MVRHMLRLRLCWRTTDELQEDEVYVKTQRRLRAELRQAPAIQTSATSRGSVGQPDRDDASKGAVEYLLDEYDHVAQAHFETISSISAFFKHYLVIMAVPITLTSALLSVTNLDPRIVQPVAGGVLAVVAVVGLSVFLYIVSLRLDVILYARTINAIRKYFTERLDPDPLVGESVRVLPKSRHQPGYHEPRFFYPVVFAFAIINGAYMGVAVSLLTGDYSAQSAFFGLAAAGVLALIHPLAYLAQARHRDSHYLAPRAIGVDIDGVINCHREMFCVKLSELTGKQLNPECIRTLPVHADEDNDVCKSDEIAVFNCPEYWSEMPVMSGAGEVLRKLRTELGYDVTLFTRRDWPDLGNLSRTERASTLRQWDEASRVHTRRWRFLTRFGATPMRTLTQQWLDAHGMGQYPLVVERGNYSRSLKRFDTRGRFAAAGTGAIRVFIEDNPENANRLAQTCDLVVLFNHPYNVDVPVLRNVIRVDDWAKVYQVVTSLP